MNFVLLTVGENLFLKHDNTINSMQPEGGTCWQLLSWLREDAGCSGARHRSALSLRHVVNGVRQNCGMTVFRGHDGEGCHEST